MSEDEDKNKKHRGKQKKTKKKAQNEKERGRVDDGLTKERRSHQWYEGLTRLFQVLLPIDTLIQDDQTRIRDGIITRLEINDLRQRLERTDRQNHRVVLELDRANLETRRAKLQLENLKTTSQLKLERAELETEKVRFQGQKEKAEQLIEMLKMKQELQQVKRDNQLKNTEIEALKAENQRLKIQHDNTAGMPASSLPYLPSGMPFLAMQQNTQLLQTLMPRRNNFERVPRNRAAAQGDGYCVCSQCMLAEFPNNYEGRRSLEAHLNSAHPQHTNITQLPVDSYADDSVVVSDVNATNNNP